MTISHHLRLLDLPDDTQELINARELSYAHGRVLLMTDDHTERRRLAREAVANDWSTRQLETAVRALATPRARKPKRRHDADQAALVLRLCAELASIEATLNYIANTGEKIFTQTGEPGSTDVRAGGRQDPRRVVIRNGRLQAEDFARWGHCKRSRSMPQEWQEGRSRVIPTIQRKTGTANPVKEV